MTLKMTLALTGTALALCAADAWKNTDYTQWSSEDAQKILTKSPWAKEAAVSMGQSQNSGQQQSRRGGGMGGGGGGMGGMGGGGMGSGRGGTGGGGGMGGGGMAQSVKITVRWESAMPVQEAELKQQYGSHLPAKGETGYTLDQPRNNYVISVTGLRMPSQRRYNQDDSRNGDTQERNPADRMKDQLMGSTQLVRKGKDPIYPQDVKIDASTNVVMFVFPKADAISEDDKDVEFTTTMGRMQVKEKFSLKEMRFGGKLEL